MTLDGTGVTGRAGTLLVAELADRLGLTAAMSDGFAPLVKRRRRRDPGVALVHLATMLVDGGDCLSDLRVLRNEPTLFGTVASDATTYRLLESGWAAEAIVDARRAARAAAWASGATPTELTLDVDATLLASHSDKEDAAPNYKGGFGFHPLGIFLDETNEALAAVLRPGNAGANDADDHIKVLHAAIAQLPEAFQAGHHEGDAPSDVAHRVLVRADSAGATHRFIEVLADTNCEFSLGFAIDQRVRDALRCAQEEDWVDAVESDGTVRDGAEVIELTELCDLGNWGDRVRLIARRERPHPGAQLTLFDTEEGARHQCFITSSQGDIAVLELRHRGHARVEDRIRDAKAMGLVNLPFRDIVPNNAWLQLVLCAMDLMAWTKAICLDGELANAEPKRLRYTFLHTAARIVTGGRRTKLRIQSNWPWGQDLVDAHARLRTITLC